MSRFCLTCIFLCVLFSADAQNARWQEAALGYERGAYLAEKHGDPGVARDMLFRKHQVLKSAGQWNEAYQTIKRIPVEETGPDSVQFTIRYEKALMAYLNGVYDDAYLQIGQCRYSVKDSVLTSRLDWLEILTLCELERWQEAQAKASAYLLSRRLPDQSKEWFRRIPRKRSERKAEYLSAFFPGVGLMYAGSLREGITSTVLQAGCLAFGVFTILDGYYLSGFLTGGGLFQAFYFGGINRSARIAAETNRRNKSTFNRSIRGRVLETEQSSAKKEP